MIEKEDINRAKRFLSLMVIFIVIFCGIQYFAGSPEEDIVIAGIGLYFMFLLMAVLFRPGPDPEEREIFNNKDMD